MPVADSTAVKHTLLEQLVTYTPYAAIGIILVILFPWVPSYAKVMFTHILIFSIFALGLNLVIGYTGLFSFGHAAFFGLASYTSAILITRFGVTSFWLNFPAGILLATLGAAVFGIIALRVSGVYFLFITMALGQLLVIVAQRLVSITKGSTGITGIGYPNLGLPFAMNGTSFYYFVLIIFVISAFLIYRLAHSPFGHALQGIRDDERLMQHLGYNTWLYKYTVFVIGGVFAGIAGILFGHFNSLVYPSYLDVTTSLTAILAILLGGPRIVFGPVLGVAAIVFVQYYTKIYLPERWPLILGSLFVICVIFLRGGMSMYLIRLWERVKHSYGSTKA